MTPAALILILLAALALPAAGQPAAETKSPLTLTGNFMSGFQDRVKPLRAEFTPADGNEWNVVFHFRFNGAEHQYVGTATGDLEQGELSGVVKNEGGRRTFSFRGEFDKGVFKGKHAELTGGNQRETGTLMLKAAKQRG